MKGEHMPTNKNIFCAVVFLAALVGAMLIPAISGCQMAKRIDEAVWNTPPATPDSEAPAAPPIVEAIAAGLGVFGFGGMAEWIRRVKKRGNGRMETLEQRIKELEQYNASKS